MAGTVGGTRRSLKARAGDTAAMAQAGQTIDNPVTGERIVFQHTARYTNGTLLRFAFFLQPGQAVPVTHLHPTQEERFQVVRGRVRVLQSTTERVLVAGDTLAIPPGTRHRVFNDGAEEAQLLVEFRPAGRAERFFEILFGLCRDGRMQPSGQVSPYQATVLMGESQFGYLAAPPVLLQRALYALLRPLGRLRGDTARYRRYVQEHRPEDAMGAAQGPLPDRSSHSPPSRRARLPL